MLLGLLVTHSQKVGTKKYMKKPRRWDFLGSLNTNIIVRSTSRPLRGPDAQGARSPQKNSAKIVQNSTKLLTQMFSKSLNTNIILRLHLGGQGMGRLPSFHWNGKKTVHAGVFGVTYGDFVKAFTKIDHHRTKEPQWTIVILLKTSFGRARRSTLEKHFFFNRCCFPTFPHFTLISPDCWIKAFPFTENQ